MKSVNSMIEFRAKTSGQPVVNPQATDSVLSFERGDVGLFAVNVTTSDLTTVEISTNLAEGKYVDLNTGNEVEISGGVVKIDLIANQAIALIKR
jgi:hypothetical protein